MISYFRVRSLQVGRSFREAGVIRIVFLVGLAIFLFLMFKATFGSYKLLPLIVIGIIVPLIHFNRKDLRFIKTSLRKPYLLLLAEYYIILFPLLLLVAITSDLFITLSCVLYIPIVSHFSIYRIRGKQRKKSTGYYSKFFPRYLFEWLAGFRKNPLIFFIYIVGLACSFLPYASAICMWIITFIISSFYEENEPLLFVLKNEVNERRFIRQKIYRHFLFYIAFISPIAVASMLFNAEQYILTLYALAASSITLMTVIVTKYATYLPSHRSTEFQITSSIAMLSIIIFPLMLFTLGALVVNYSRALNNLNDYLDAYN